MAWDPDLANVGRLMKETGCGGREARFALKLRKNIFVFAVEYLERRDAPGSMSPEERFPRWFQYLSERRRV